MLKITVVFTKELGTAYVNIDAHVEGTTPISEDEVGCVAVIKMLIDLIQQMAPGAHVDGLFTNPQKVRQLAKGHFDDISDQLVMALASVENGKVVTIVPLQGGRIQ